MSNDTKYPDANTLRDYLYMIPSDSPGGKVILEITNEWVEGSPQITASVTLTPVEGFKLIQDLAKNLGLSDGVWV